MAAALMKMTTPWVLLFCISDEPEAEIQASPEETLLNKTWLCSCMQFWETCTYFKASFTIKWREVVKEYAVPPCIHSKIDLKGRIMMPFDKWWSLFFG